MANISERRNKNGEITSYRIRVNKGYNTNGKKLKPYEASFRPDINRTDKQNSKALNEFAVEFEKKCKEGFIADAKYSFQEYSEYVLNLKLRQRLKHSTLVRYKELLKSINHAIGFMKISDIRPQHLNNLYESLAQNGVRQGGEKAVAKIDLKDYLKKNNILQKDLTLKANIGQMTLRSAMKYDKIMLDNAEKISNALGVPCKKLFRIEKDNRPYSNKTICEYHRLISTILRNADKEMLIPFNPANKATPPKVNLRKRKPNYFDIEDVERIIECADHAPLKWKTMINLLLVTGCRRAEIVGLQWDRVFWDTNQIHIEKDLLNSVEIGIYEDTVKTEESDRYVKLPVETMELLKEYHKWYLKQKEAYGSRWHDTDYLFFQEKSGNEGKPINPRFSKQISQQFFRKKQSATH